MIKGTRVVGQSEMLFIIIIIIIAVWKTRFDHLKQSWSIPDHVCMYMLTGMSNIGYTFRVHFGENTLLCCRIVAVIV